MKRRQWELFLLGITFMIIQSWLDLRLPDYMSRITEMVQTGTATTEGLLAMGGMVWLAIRERDVTILTETACESIEPDGVVVRKADGSREKLLCDTAAYCVGMRSNQELFQEVWDCAPEVYRVGGGIKPGTVREAILTGYYTAAEI